MNTCEYCNKTFANKFTLMNHIKKTKKCINNRLTEDLENKEFECEYCQKNFTTKQRLNTHIDKCNTRKINIEKNEYENNLLKKDIEINSIIKEKNLQIEKIESQNKIYLEKIVSQNEIQIEKFENQIKELQDTIAKLADKAISKPTIKNTNNSRNVTSNTQYNNIQPVNLSPEHIEKVINEQISFQDVIKGKKGFVNFVVNNFLKDEKGNYKAWCPDHNRKIIRYKDENNDIVKDPSGYNIIKSIAPAFEKKTREINDIFSSKYYKYDKNGKFVNKKKEELSDNESDDSDSDILDEDEDDYSESDRDILDETDEDTDLEEEYQKNKKTFALQMLNNEIMLKVNNLVSEMNEYKKNYNPDKIDYYFNKLVESLQEVSNLNENYETISRQLSYSLPDKAKKGIFDYDGPKTTKFNFDPSKI